jgi:hypothetical protein
MRVLFATLVALALAGVAQAEDMLKPGDIISGRLRFFRHQHPNGTWINVYQLNADNPRKFAEADEFCDPKIPPKTFHLIVMEDKAKKAQLDKLLGKTVAVVGEAFFCSETAWHVGDAVLSQWHLADPPKR